VAFRDTANRSGPTVSPLHRRRWFCGHPPPPTGSGTSPPDSARGRARNRPVRFPGGRSTPAAPLPGPGDKKKKKPARSPRASHGVSRRGWRSLPCPRPLCSLRYRCFVSPTAYGTLFRRYSLLVVRPARCCLCTPLDRRRRRIAHFARPLSRPGCRTRGHRTVAGRWLLPSVYLCLHAKKVVPVGFPFSAPTDAEDPSLDAPTVSAVPGRPRPLQRGHPPTIRAWTRAVTGADLFLRTAAGRWTLRSRASIRAGRAILRPRGASARDLPVRTPTGEQECYTPR